MPAVTLLPHDRAHRSRRRRRILQWCAWLVAAGVLAVCVQGFVVEPAQLVERDYALAPRGWPQACDGLRVDVVADTHTGSPRNGLDHLDEMVRELANDDSQVVLMAGDYVILKVLLGRYVPASDTAEHLKPLLARKPVYAVLGNHDWWHDGPRFMAALRRQGIVVLENEARAIDANLWVVGVGDHSTGHSRPRAALAGVPARAQALVMMHDPASLFELPPVQGLVVAAHTHGGQIRLPFIGAPVVPGAAPREWAYGWVDHGTHRMYVTSGLGVSILPVRFNIRPEWVLFRLAGAMG